MCGHSSRLIVELDKASVTKLNLYAAVTHQTADEAAQELLKLALDNQAEARIQHRIDQHVESVRELGNVQRAIRQAK